MDEDISCCCGCLLVIFLIFAGISAVDNISHWHWDNYELDDAYLTNYDSGVTNASRLMSNGEIDNDYMYHVYFYLDNASSDFIDSDVVVYFYDVKNRTVSDYKGYNNTTEHIDDDIYSDSNNNIFISSYLHSENFTNITHVEIIIIKDNEVVFSTSQTFNMKKFDSLYDDMDESTDKDDDVESSFTDNSADDSSSDYQSSYVGSVNSDKFHDPSCSQAKRIKDGNLITFSSRQDAIDAGYSPCGICHP